VRVELGVILIAASLLGPFLYFVSLCSCITRERIRATEWEPTAWVFLHRNSLGLGLGILWLFAPGLVLAAAWLVNDRREWSTAGLLVLLFAAAAWAMQAALRTRRTWLTESL